MYPLGRHVEHDPRSKSYPAVRMALASPRTVLWDHNAPVLDQGQVGSCTGNALAQWLNCDVNKPARFLTEDDALSLYELATTLDNVPGAYPPDDTGSSGLAVCKAGVKKGYLSGYKWSFTFNSLLLALQRGPVIVGTDWYESMFTPDTHGFLPVHGTVVGGHEYLILGADIEHGFLTMLNSWSSSWGKNGRAFIRFDDFKRLQAARGDVKQPVLAHRT